MICSEARLAANRMNALRSTGPRTAAGKAVARMNAWKHGMAAAADRFGSADDEGRDDRAVARRAAGIVRDAGARGEMADVLARRAAILSVRMERAAEQASAAATTRARAARERFDAERIAAVLAGIDAAEAGNDPRPALAELEATAEGRDYLADAWAELAARLAAGDESAATRAAAWLGLDVDADTGVDLAAGVAVAARRARDLQAAKGRLIEATDAGRDRAGRVARFDTDPAAELARRYEANAERGMYRALEAVRKLGQAQAQAEATLLEANYADEPPPLPADDGDPPAAVVAGIDRLLGSFGAGRPGGDAVPAGAVATPVREPGVAVARPVPAVAERRRRPDLRKLDRKRR